MKTQDPAQKIMTLEEAVAWRKNLRGTARTLAVTNGCFDLLHRGHASYLMTAAGSADKLLLLVNSDESVRELKGPDRPLNCEYDRAYLLACLEFVDAVVIFNSKRCNRELSAIQPDVYVKGGDYTVETLDPDERAALQEANAEIAFIQFLPNHSTSLLIRKMKG